MEDGAAAVVFAPRPEPNEAASERRLRDAEAVDLRVGGWACTVALCAAFMAELQELQNSWNDLAFSQMVPLCGMSSTPCQPFVP